MTRTKAHSTTDKEDREKPDSDSIESDDSTTSTSSSSTSSSSSSSSSSSTSNGDKKPTAVNNPETARKGHAEPDKNNASSDESSKEDEIPLPLHREELPGFPVTAQEMEEYWKSVEEEKEQARVEECAATSERPARLLMTQEEIVQDPENPLPGWRLIAFHELDHVTRRGMAPTNWVMMRLGPKASLSDLNREMDQIFDMRQSLQIEVEGVLKSMMLEESIKVLPSRGFREPMNMKDVKNLWRQDSSPKAAEAVWQVLFGMFDRLNMKYTKTSWDKRLEEITMKKAKVAYLKNTIPKRTSQKGGPDKAGCVRLLIRYVKSEIVKTVQRAGLQSHGHSIVVKKEKFARPLFPGDERHRVPGVMQPYMYFHRATSSFPLLLGNHPGVEDLSKGKVLLQHDPEDVTEQLRRKVREQEKKIKEMERQARVDQSHLRHSLGVIQDETNMQTEGPVAIVQVRKLERDMDKRKERDATPKKKTSPKKKSQKKKAMKRKKKRKETPASKTIKTAKTHKEVLSRLPKPAWLILEDLESIDVMEYGDAQGDEMTHVLGSKIIDNALKVYVKWDNNPSTITLEDIGPVFQDDRSLFEMAEQPPRIRKWIAMNKKRYPMDEETETEMSAEEDEVTPVIKVPCDHEDVMGFIKEDNAAFCGGHAYLHGSYCRVCRIKFVEKVVDKKTEYRPTDMTPVMYCPNYAKICSYAICVNCHFETIEKRPRKRRRV